MSRLFLFIVMLCFDRIVFAESIVWNMPTVGVMKGKDLHSFVLQQNTKVKIPVTLSYSEQELLSLGGEGNYSFIFKEVCWQSKGVSNHILPASAEAEKESQVFNIKAQKPKGDILIDRSDSSPSGAFVLASEGTGGGGHNRLHVLDVSVKRNPSVKNLNKVEVSRLEIDCLVSGQASVTKAYLYSGGKELDSGLVQGGKAVFSNIDKNLPPVNAKTFSVYLDIREARSEVSIIHVVLTSVSGTSSSRIVSLPIRSDDFLITNVGPKVSVSSQPQLLVVEGKQGRVIQVLFELELEACGGDVELGSQVICNTFRFSVLRDGKVVR